MKTNGCLILGMMMTAGALAQDNTNALPPMPAPLVAPAAEQPAAAPAVTPAAKPAPVKHKKHAVALVEPTVALVPGTAVVTVNSANVRGQAGLKGEVIGKLAKGDVVTVLVQENLHKHEVGEPAQWANISLPASIKVWLNAKFIDATNNTVLPKKLNLRAGPGENYSVLGTIERGTVVNPISTKGDWAQIDPPASASGFVAAIYLRQEASGTLVTNLAPSSETAPTPTAVTENQPIVTEPAVAGATGAAGAGGAAANGAGAGAANANVSSASAAVDTNAPPPVRVVSHEGVVANAGSLIAPTAYVLYDPATSTDINFLYSTSTNLDIGRYYGMRIIVTGAEGLADRWPETPVLTIQRIEVLETNAIPKAYYPTPRQRG
jgi:uncharacterized protein YgiM (DUF1202 family)